jgi:hypothetical protein
MSKFTVYVLALVKLTALVCVGILCVGMLYGLLYLTTPRFPLVNGLHTISLHGLARFLTPRDRNNPDEDHADVISHHRAIRSWIIDCMGLKGVHEILDSPSDMRDIFFVAPLEI